MNNETYTKLIKFLDHHNAQYRLLSSALFSKTSFCPQKCAWVNRLFRKLGVPLVEFAYVCKKKEEQEW